MLLGIEDLFTSEINSQFALSTIVEHGGVADDDRHVGSLVNAPGLEGKTINDPVETSEIALTNLQTFAIDADWLKGAREEHTRPPPGLRFGG